MVRSRRRLLASFAAVVALTYASQASAQALLVLAYSNAKTFGNVHIAGGAIDITSGAMIVSTSGFGFVPSIGGHANGEYGSAGVAEFGDAAIHDAIVEGFDGGAWNGSNGIISSTAATDPSGLTAVGWIDNDALGAYSIYRGITLHSGQSIIAYTYYGDTDLSGYVDDADVNNVNNNFGSNLPGDSYLGGSFYPDWADGDTNYSQSVDVGDRYAVESTYHLPRLFSVGPQAPEPGTFALFFGALMAMGAAYCRRRGK